MRTVRMPFVVLADPQWVDRGVSGPSPRCEYGMAYDSAREITVLFGGSSDLSFTAVNRETWEWDGTQWDLRATTGPSPRCDNAFAYDSARQRTVSFGGYNGVYLGDTWEWDGTAWSQVVVTSPTPRADAFMVFDRTRNVMVLFGGQNATGTIQSDTWEYDGTTWVRRALTGPPRRWIQRMAFDRDRGVTVMYGGASPTGLLSDTWEWNGTAWNQVNIPGPPARYGNAMCYDVDRRLSLVHGGQSGSNFGANPLGDTWEYDGAVWSERAIAGPPARTFVKMVYDEARRRAVLFGGWANGPLADTWELTNDPPTAVAVALVSAEAQPDRVEMIWHAGVTGPVEGTVLRRQEHTDWSAVGRATTNGTGHLRFEDTAVSAGERYGYRLELRGPAEIVRSSETWVDVPRDAAFSLRGFHPNPAVAELRVAFSLPSTDSARLELLDVTGRRVLAHDLAGIEPGSHVVNLGSTSAMRAGVYWLRLAQGSEVRTVRGVIAR
ncbi:MAG TPA: hypothetical protein VEY91_01440 [Candidatus Limnocylindria bacterium]|nr:hypothetical protein [Candidatus Limnocylindria bacterium]